MTLRTIGPCPAYNSDKQEVRTSQSPIEEEITEYWAQKIAANYAELRARYVILFQPHICRPGTYGFNVTRLQQIRGDVPPPATIAKESLEGYEAADERSASDEDESMSPSTTSGCLRYSDIAAELRYLDDLRTSPIPIPSNLSDTSSTHTTYTPTSTQPSPVRNFSTMFEDRDDFGKPLVDELSLSKEPPECSSRKAKGSG